jgi:hypothetical protein
LFGFAGYYLFVNAHKLSAFEWHLRPVWIAAAAAIVLGICPLIRVWLWMYVLGKMKCALSFSECFRIIRISQLAKYLPGKVWHYVSALHLTHKYGATKAVSFSAMIYDSGASFIGGAMTAVLCMMVSSHYMTQKSLWVVVAGNVILGLIFLSPRLFSAALRCARRIGNWLPGKWSGLIASKLPSSTDLPRIPFPTIAVLIILNAGFWLLFGSALYCLIRGVSQGAMPFADSVVVAAIGVLAGFIAPLVPSGIGITEGMQVLLLSSYFPVEVCLAIALLFRVLNILKEIVLGLVAIAIEPISAADSTNHREIRDNTDGCSSIKKGEGHG